MVDRTQSSAPYRWVADAAELDRLCAGARGLARIAIDLEANSFHAYRTRLCLLQLGTGSETWLVDTLAMSRAEMAPLAALLADEAIEKVLHGADYDMRLLDRELGVSMRGLRDTQIAAQLAGTSAFGLAALLEQELGVQVDKRFQRADWGARPLAAELLVYAAADVAHLFELADLLQVRLEALGRVEWWREECAALELVHWDEAPADPLAFRRVRGANMLRGAARDRLAALWGWREGEAAALDTPPFRVLQPEVMLALAAAPPGDMDALEKTRGIGRSLVRRHGRTLLALLGAPPPAPVAEARVPPVRDRQREARIDELRAARDVAAVELGLDSGLLAPRAALEAVADARPGDREALAGCLGRQWRAVALAPVLLPVVSNWGAEVG